MIEMMVLSFLSWVVVLGGGGYLALRFIRALERRGLAPGEVESLKGRILELEGQVEGMQKEVERISDEQSFTTRLLSDRMS